MSSTELKSVIGKLATAARKNHPSPEGPPRREVQKLDLTPGCAFGAILDERLRAMAAEISEVKGRINAVLFAVVVAVVVEVVMRLVK